MPAIAGWRQASPDRAQHFHTVAYSLTMRRSYAGLPIIVVFERVEKGCNPHATQRFFLPAVQGDL
jgi:hypothetical protein